MTTEVEGGALVVGNAPIVAHGGLVQQSASGLMVAVPEDHADAGIFAKGRDFLPLVMLQVGTSDAVKDKKIEANHYAVKVGKDQLIDLGEQFICIPQAWRYSASQLLVNNATGKREFSVCYDKADPAFLSYKAEADAGKWKIYKYGYDALVWIPIAGLYAILPFNSKTSRNIWPKLYKNEQENQLGKATVLNSQEIVTSDNTWRAYAISNYIGQVAPEQMPSQQQFQTAVSKFQMKGKATSAQETEGIETVPAAVATGAPAATSTSRG